MQPWSVGHIDQAAAHVVGGAGVVWNQSTAGPGLTFPTAVSVNGQGVSGTASSVRTTTSHSAGKYYVEFTIGTQSFKASFGLGNSSLPNTGDLGNDANPSNGCGCSTDRRFFSNANGGLLTISTDLAATDTMDVAINMDDTPNLIWYRRNNGAWNPQIAGTQDPALTAGTGGGIAFRTLNSSTMVAGPYYFAMSTWAVDATARFASSSWTHTAPTGYLQW